MFAIHSNMGLKIYDRISEIYFNQMHNRIKWKKAYKVCSLEEGRMENF